MGNGSGRVKCSDGSAGTSGVSMPPITAAPPRLPIQAELPTAATAEELTNPGDYEDIGKRVKEQLFPQPFEGCKVVVQKGLSKHFQTNHTLTLGPSSSQWHFGATFVGSKKVAENDFRPVLMGELTNNGSFTALLLHQFGSAWRLKCNAQTQQAKWVGYQGTLDYHGADFTASLTLANPDPIAGSVVAVAQYLQALTPRLALGTELLYQVGGGMQNALLSLGGRYKAQDWELAARLGLHTWHVTYHHQLKDLVLMAECDGSLMQAESTAAVGYRLELGAMTVRGRVDTHGTVAVGVERRLEPLPATLLLSGQLNHWTDESKFGVAITVG